MGEERYHRWLLLGCLLLLPGIISRGEKNCVRLLHTFKKIFLLYTCILCSSMVRLLGVMLKAYNWDRLYFGTDFIRRTTSPGTLAAKAFWEKYFLRIYFLRSKKNSSKRYHMRGQMWEPIQWKWPGLLCSFETNMSVSHFLWNRGNIPSTSATVRAVKNLSQTLNGGESHAVTSMLKYFFRRKMCSLLTKIMHAKKCFRINMINESSRRLRPINPKNLTKVKNF